MSKTPNYKAEAHKAITRILSLDSRVQRERVLAEFLKDIHERGEVAAVKAMSGSGEPIKRQPAPQQKQEKIPGLDDFVQGLGNLGKTMKDLTRELAGVR